MRRLLAALGMSVYCFAALAESIAVVDQSGRPIAGATIMLGLEPGQPFPGNVFTTDEKGLAGVPADWKAALPITVQAPGYIVTTLPEAQPGLAAITLTKREPEGDIEVKGTATEFGRLVRDGKVDFGLVIPALKRSQMLAFDVSSIISPQNDEITIIGNTAKIPSNLTLPQQQETYIFPIELNKPDYRIYVREPGEYKVGVIHGQFPLQRVVGDIRAGKSFLEIVNHFDFKESGQTTLNIDRKLEGVNLPVNQVPFNGTFTLKAPTFDNSLAMLSLAMIKQNDVYMPTDVKRLTPGQSLNMKTNAQAGEPAALSLLLENTSSVVADLTDTLRTWFGPLFEIENLGPLPWETRPRAEPNFNKLSFAFLSATGGAQPQFLSMINPPQINGQSMKLQVPSMVNGLVAAGAYITLSEIQQFGDGNIKIERRTRVWEIWADAWVSDIELPKVTINRRSDRKYRWEVLFLARPANAAPGLDSITHATRNAIDL